MSLNLLPKQVRGLVTPLTQMFQQAVFLLRHQEQISLSHQQALVCTIRPITLSLVGHPYYPQMARRLFT
jgi:hypothetical protein